MILKDGIILKGIGGFYYVETADKIYECKARGIFRKNKDIIPYAGDNVIIDINDDGTGIITQIFKRKNSFLRPQIANIDNLLIVCSIKEPCPSIVNIDKIIALAESQGITPVLIISKTDLDNGRWLEDIYTSAGIKTIMFSAVKSENADEIKKIINSKITAFTGNSGVGKSTLLNNLFCHLNLDTAPISNKLGRGKHTTRHVELYKVDCNSYVADTPGFSSIDINKYDIIKEKSELAKCFIEFKQHIGKCKFTSCSHTCEKGCAVIEALNNGKISQSRFDSYVRLYNELKDKKYEK